MKLTEAKIREAQAVIESVMEECDLHGINFSAVYGVAMIQKSWHDIEGDSLADLCINRLHEQNGGAYVPFWENDMKFTEAKIRAINARWTGENYPLDSRVDSNFARNDILDLLDEIAALHTENERLKNIIANYRFVVGNTGHAMPRDVAKELYDSANEVLGG